MARAPCQTPLPLSCGTVASFLAFLGLSCNVGPKQQPWLPRWLGGGCAAGRGRLQCCVHVGSVQKGCLLFGFSLHAQPDRMAAARVTCQGLSWPGLCGYVHLKSPLLKRTYLRATANVRSLKVPPPNVYTDLLILLHLAPPPPTPLPLTIVQP